MKARTEADLETAYDAETFGTFTSSIKNGLKENFDTKATNFSIDESASKNACSISCDNSVISNPASSFPLHFNTREALDKTPAIFKPVSSGNSGGRGSDTFVFSSYSKPISLHWNEDPCRTFVITSDKWESLNEENEASKGSDNFNSSEKNEYLSYIIEKRIAPEKMSEESNRLDNISKQDLNNFEDDDDKCCRVSHGLERVDDENCRCEESEPGEKVDLNESEICDKKVQCGNEKNLIEDATVLSFDKAIAGRKEQKFARLQDELQKAHQELKLKDEEVTRLTRIREDVERELEELTASLFQEAHKMVTKAKEKQAAAEKSLNESQMKVDVLMAEVIALKTLVLTSTPSKPNPHLHPQIGKEENSGGVNLFNKKHRRSPSHFNLKYGRENSPPESPVRDEQNTIHNTVSASIENKDISEVDPAVYKEFMTWIALTFKLDKTDPFIDRIYREDINLCLDFSNRELAEKVQKAIETRNIYIEAVTDKTKTIFPRKCALLEVSRQCCYRMKLGDEDTWYNISQMCRNRIIAVCDFINYLRYIELGLVKSSVQDMYWEIVRLRKEMVLARLGLSLSPP